MRVSAKTAGLAVSALACVAVSHAALIEMPAQSFEAGGWGLDVQFMDIMGSPYFWSIALSFMSTASA